MKKFIVVIWCFLALPAIGATIASDTQAKVDMVKMYAVNGSSVVLIYFNQQNTDYDRWGCIAGQGYVKLQAGVNNVTEDSIKIIYSAAITAMTTGKSFGVNSGFENCNNGSSAQIVN